MKIRTMGLFAGSSIMVAALCLVSGGEANQGWQPPERADTTQLGRYARPGELPSAERLAGLLGLLREVMRTSGGFGMGMGGGPTSARDSELGITLTIGRVVPPGEVLSALEAEEDPEIRDRLKIAAVLAGHDGFRDDLVRIASEHEMGPLRWLAVQALGGLEDATLEPVFRERLTDPYARLQYGWAGVAAADDTTPSPPDHRRKVYPVREAAVEALARIGVTEVNAVTYQPLESRGRTEAIAFLLEDRDPQVCLAAAHILARDGGEEGLPHLRRFIEEARDDPDLRDAVRVAELAPLTSDELVDALRDALAAGDRPAYQAAADILQARREIEPVAAAWDDADPTMRRALAWIAGQISGREATELLVEAFFSEEEGALRREALDMLGRSPRSLQRQLTGPEQAQLREIVLSGSLEDAAKVAMFAWDIRSSIAERLRREVTEDPVRPDTPPERIWELNRMVERLSRRQMWESLEEAEGDWAMWVAIALGRVGEKVAGDTLKDALERERNPYVRYLLVRSLASALGEEAIPLLEDLAQEETMAKGSVFRPSRRHVETPIVSEAAQRELNRLRPR
jgi:HEAT repeat protein